MGKGDRRTRRGKIYAGSFGKSRPKVPKSVKAKSAKAGASAARAAAPASKPASKAPARKKSA